MFNSLIEVKALMVHYGAISKRSEGMNFRGVGVSFLMFSVLLFSSRYIAAAIYGMDSVTKDRELFQNLLDFTGNTLFNLSVISLVIGVLYLVVGEVINTLYFKNRNKGNGQM